MTPKLCPNCPAQNPQEARFCHCLRKAVSHRSFDRSTQAAQTPVHRARRAGCTVNCRPYRQPARYSLNRRAGKNSNRAREPGVRRKRLQGHPCKEPHETKGALPGLSSGAVPENDENRLQPPLPLPPSCQLPGHLRLLPGGGRGTHLPVRHRAGSGHPAQRPPGGQLHAAESSSTGSRPR